MPVRPGANQVELEDDREEKEMNRPIRFLSLLILASAVSACASTKGGAGVDVAMGEQLKPVPREIQFRSLDTRRGLSGAGVLKPEEVVLFAARLSREGKHSEAGRFFMKAADVPSVNEEFRISCLQSAAVSYFLAGDNSLFNSTLEDLLETANPFQVVTLPPPTQVLLALRASMDGDEVRLGPDVPFQVRMIFENGEQR